jgi:hypothetical protein
MQWRDQLHRLNPLQNDLALLPVGWGGGGKAPMLAGWQKHPGFTVEQLQEHHGIRAVGARTGLLTGPLLAFDFDGASALELGLHPWDAVTWQVHRDDDPFRLKVLFRPTPEQLTELPQTAPSGPEFQGKTPTAPPADGSKGEALEVFFAGGRQVIVIGEHPSSGGHYLWPDGLGPEALAPPPEHWWQHAMQLAQQQASPTRRTAQRSTTRNGTRRLNPCPICSRHDGPGGSELWCEETTDGLILCMPGSTFSAEQRHGPLVVGDVVEGGWALVKRTRAEAGEVLAFRQHRPRRKPNAAGPVSRRAWGRC